MSTVCLYCRGRVLPHGDRLKCLDCGRIQMKQVEQGWFSKSDAARYLGCCRRKVYDYIRQVSLLR